jgi:hypothetical protein
MKPIKEAQAFRNAYLDSHGKKRLILSEYQAEVADIFAESATIDHLVVPSYGAFMAELAEQFDYMTNYVGVVINFCEYDPSKDDTRAISMRDAFMTNGVLDIFRSQGDHVILDQDGLPYKGRVETFNSVFRAVHDYFGHCASGGEFSWVGETRAYISHAAMFSDKAKRALFSETVAQQCWYAVHKDYSEQKCVYYEDWYLNNIPLS